MSNVKEKFLRNELIKTDIEINDHLDHIHAFKESITLETEKEYKLWISQRESKINLILNMKEKLEDELNQEILNKQPKGSQ